MGSRLKGQPEPRLWRLTAPKEVWSFLPRHLTCPPFVCGCSEGEAGLRVGRGTGVLWGPVVSTGPVPTGEWGLRGGAQCCMLWGLCWGQAGGGAGAWVGGVGVGGAGRGHWPGLWGWPCCSQPGSAEGLEAPPPPGQWWGDPRRGQKAGQAWLLVPSHEASATLRGRSMIPEAPQLQSWEECHVLQ